MLEVSSVASIRYLVGFARLALAGSAIYWLLEAWGGIFLLGDPVDIGEWFEVLLTLEEYYPALFLLSAALFVLWSFNAHRNLTRLGRTGIRHQDQATIWWWIVPFANLFMPFRVIYETVRGSVSRLGAPKWRSSRLPGVAKWWTGFFLGGLFLTQVPTGMLEDGTISFNAYFSVFVLGTLLSAGAAIAAIVLIETVTKGQVDLAAQILSGSASTISIEMPPPVELVATKTTEQGSSDDPTATGGRHLRAFCTGCGHPFDPDDRFCADCGAPRQSPD